MIRSSDTVVQTSDARALRTVLAAVEVAARLHAVPDDAHTAGIAARRQRLDRALEAVERMGLAIHPDLERLVVVVTAQLALRHTLPPHVSVRAHGCTPRARHDRATGFRARVAYSASA